MNNHTTSVILTLSTIGALLASSLFPSAVATQTPIVSASTPYIISHKPDVPPVVLVSQQLPANDTLTRNMLKVRSMAEQYGHHETMQAILLQESKGGLDPTIKSYTGSGSYGLMQVQIVAARSVLSKYPNIREIYFPGRKLESVKNKEIVALLVDNDDANIHIAIYHFNLYLSIVRGNWTKAVAAYNMGIGNALKIASHDDNPYVKSIRTKIQTTVRQFNNKHPAPLSI